MSDYSTIDKLEWFINKMSSGWFSRQELIECAATEFPAVDGKTLNGTLGQYWSDCVNPKWSTWKSLTRRGLKVTEFDGRRHIEKDLGSPSPPPTGVPVPGLTFGKALGTGEIVEPPRHRVAAQIPAVTAPTNLSSLTRTMWTSNDRGLWDEALSRYWTFVKAPNMALEREIDQLNPDSVQRMNPQEWYQFLLEKYFRWKFTAPNRYGSTSKLLRSYNSSDGLLVLHDIKERLFSFNKGDIQQGLAIACSIRGLGTAGGSGLLAVLFPRHFGTVDQFAVKALVEIPELSERALVAGIKPESIKPSEGVTLIQIMRQKAADLNSTHATDEWTPRKVDMVLWTCAR